MIFDTRMTKKDNEKQKQDQIIMVHKDFQSSHFDYSCHSSVERSEGLSMSFSV